MWYCAIHFEISSITYLSSTKWFSLLGCVTCILWSGVNYLDRSNFSSANKRKVFKRFPLCCSIKRVCRRSSSSKYGLRIHIVFTFRNYCWIFKGLFHFILFIHTWIIYFATIYFTECLFEGRRLSSHCQQLHSSYFPACSFSETKLSIMDGWFVVRAV